MNEIDKKVVMIKLMETLIPRGVNIPADRNEMHIGIIKEYLNQMSNIPEEEVDYDKTLQEIEKELKR